MPYLLIRQKVTDYAQWKSAFDAHSVTRQANGSRGGQLSATPLTPMKWSCFSSGMSWSRLASLRNLKSCAR